MNINKFTQKSLQAVQDCERVAMEYGNQEIEQEHLLYALLTQDDSLIMKLMEKMSIDKNVIINRVEDALRKKRKPCMVGTGSMSDPYMPLELELRYTRRALELIERYGFGATLVKLHP